MATATKPKTRKRGRPAQGPYSDKQKVISTRITGDLRKALDDESKRTGHSLSQIIESRLRRSFDQSQRVNENFGGPEKYNLFRLFVLAMDSVEATTGQCWHEDAYTHEQCKQAVLGVLKDLRPKGRAEPPADWPWKAPGFEPKDLGKAAALGAVEQIAIVGEPTFGKSPAATIVASNIKRGLGSLVERLEQALKGRERKTRLITTVIPVPFMPDGYKNIFAGRPAKLTRKRKGKK